MKEKLKQHGMHIAMCAPMVVVGGILLATGASVGVLVPIAGCVLMMALMMQAMSHGDGQSGSGS
jgi:hypothetical protein